jgi:Ni,Fe-hydrogenase III large subunit
LLGHVPEPERGENKQYNLKPDTFAISVTEGWRGEICHAAITDGQGELIIYKVKDPSFHNWLALALAVRNNEISDFPVCNKSFNLSYCGHDL